MKFAPAIQILFINPNLDNHTTVTPSSIKRPQPSDNKNPHCTQVYGPHKIGKKIKSTHVLYLLIIQKNASPPTV